MKIGFWFCIAIGLLIFAFATWGRAAEGGSAIGVFFVLLGLYGFNHLHMAKLEQALKEIKRKGSEEG
jgi:hypothetical protein